MTRKQMSDLCKTVESEVRRRMPIPISESTDVLPQELSIVEDAVVLWILTIGDILTWQRFDHRSRCNFLHWLSKKGLGWANNTLKDIDQQLLHLDSLKAFRAYWCSLDTAQKSFSSFVKMDCELFFVTWNAREAARLLQGLRTMLLFVSHLTLTDPSARDASYEKYFSNLERVAACRALPNSYMKLWLDRLNLPSPWQFNARVNTGSVAELATKKSDGSKRSLTEYEKLLLINTPALHYFLKKCEIEYRPPWPVAPTNRTSRVTDVPKGLGERRIISPEPAALMFIQQSLAKTLDFRLTKLRSHVDLHDQSKNSELARLGSESARYACIDLSSASDSVRWNFVKTLFERRKDWVMALQLCRTTSSAVQKQLRVNSHFAPMGSAMCFPMETLCFCAIVEEAFRICKIPVTRRSYMVYGDDIVVDDRVFQKTCQLLEAFGFAVNSEKSFSSADPNFREACGGHWYHGYDVAPIRLSRKFKGLRSCDAKSYYATVDLCNRFWFRLPTGHYYIFQKANELWPMLNFTNEWDQADAIYTQTTLFSQETTSSIDLWKDVPQHPDYQVPYYRKIALVLKNGIADGDFVRYLRKRNVTLLEICDANRAGTPWLGEMCLFKWQVQQLNRELCDLPSEQTVSVSTGAPTMELTTKWSPCQDPIGAGLTLLGKEGRIVVL